MNQPSTRIKIDPIDIRVGDLVEREATFPSGAQVIRRGRVTENEGEWIDFDGINARAHEPRGRVESVTWFLLERALEPDEAERLRIADILTEHARVGGNPSTSNSLAEDRRFQKLYAALDQHGSMVKVANIAAWICAGAVVPE